MEDQPIIPATKDESSERTPQGRGCLAGLGIMVVGFVLFIGGIYTFGGALFDSEGFSAAKDTLFGMFKHPAREPLLNAGCDHAMVMDISRFEKMDIEDQDQVADYQKNIGSAVIVACGADDASALECDKLAPLVAGAMEPKKAFSLYVHQAGSETPKCAKVYTSSGSYEKEVPNKDYRFQGN